MAFVRQVATDSLESPAIRAIGDREFTRFQRLIHDEAGIYLNPTKKTLLVARLSKRLRALNLDSFRAYYDYVVAGEDPAERARMINCICTNVTSFFREPEQFAFLADRVLPKWIEEARAGRRARRIRVWSAGCSTGEEPYSVAMLLLHSLSRAPGWAIEVFATDVSTRVLEQARQGIFSLDKREEIPEQYLKRFMRKGRRSQEGKMRVGPDVRRIVHFDRLNLNDERYAVRGRFDLILCRNVLIYFKREARLGVVHGFLDRLEPSGYLLLGHSESLHGAMPRAKAVMPTVYRLATATERNGYARIGVRRSNHGGS